MEAYRRQYEDGRTRPESEHDYKPRQAAGEEHPAAGPLHHRVRGLRGPHCAVDGGRSEVDQPVRTLHGVSVRLRLQTSALGAEKKLRQRDLPEL